MAQGKKSFIAYSDWKDTFDSLPDEIAGKLIKHIFAYVNDENPETDDYVIKGLFASIRNTLKRDLKKWEKQHQQRVDAGKRSAEVRKQNAALVNGRSISSTVSVSVSDSVSDNEKEDLLLLREKFSKNNYFKDECIKSKEWLQVVEMQRQLYKGTIEIFLERFNFHLIEMQELKKSLKEYKTHFVNWLNKQDLSGHREKVVTKTNQV